MGIYKIRWSNKTFYVKAKDTLDAWRKLLKHKNSKLSPENCLNNIIPVEIGVIE